MSARNAKKRNHKHRSSTDRVPTLLQRHHFLDGNHGDLVESIVRSGIADPVGIVVDLRDSQGRQFALNAGVTSAEIEDGIRTAGRNIPTFITTISFDEALAVMPNTSPTAVENLHRIKRLCDGSGTCPVIAIMGGGNTYGVVEKPKAAIPDGNHRHR